jgi:RNA polymerase sigma factor (TIGR02999 family)
MNPETAISIAVNSADESEWSITRVVPAMYDRLRMLATRYLSGRGRMNETLQATAVVNEAWLKLAGRNGGEINSETHAEALAAAVMKQVVIDHARGRGRAKRGGDLQRETLSGRAECGSERHRVSSELGDALAQLAVLDERAARVVELRFLAGMSEEETAAALDVSVRTVRNDWRMAKAWLQCVLGERESF